MAYLRSKYTPVALSTAGDVTLTGTQTLTNKTFVAPALGTVASGNINATTRAGGVLQKVMSRTSQEGHVQLLSGNSWVVHARYNDMKFTFTPKSTTSKLLLTYGYGISHGSTGGGQGWMAFTKDNSRSAWEGGLHGYTDGYGHFATGMKTTAQLYHTCHGMLTVDPASLTPFVLALHVKRENGQWYYGHDGGYHILTCTEILDA